MNEKSKPADREKRTRKSTGRTDRVGRNSKHGRRPAAINSGNWIYGSHAARAVLANPHRRIHKLLATSEALVPRHCQAQLDCAPEIVAREYLDEILPEGAVHQGIVLLAEPLTPPSLTQICTDTTPDAAVLMLDQVTDPRNLGAALRAAAAFAAIAVIVQDRHAPEVTGAAAKAASGAAELLPPVRVTNLARTLDLLGDAGYWRLGLDGDAQRSLAAARPADGWRRTVLVLGAEDRGLRPLVARSCDELVRIPITRAPAAGLESLNVASATAVAFYELRRASGVL